MTMVAKKSPSARLRKNVKLDKSADGQKDIERGRERGAVMHEPLLAWYRKNRRDLPWRRTRDPYAIWLSEVMLQQTRVETVLPYYARFLETFPTVSALAEAPLDQVLTLWAGLGYYRRARMLHAAARQVHDRHGGALPSTVLGLRSVHGIGPYTAGAVGSIAFDLPTPLVDGNVARVVARLFALGDDMRKPAGMARVWRIAEGMVPVFEPPKPPAAGDWNQALMELGATICVPRSPRCLICPLAATCEARAQGLEQELPVMSKKAEPTREARTAIVATRGDSVLLAQRCPDVRFGGMWEPPSSTLEPTPTAEKLVTSLAGAALTNLRAVGDLVHVLSHRRLEVTVHAGELTRDPKSDPPSDEYERRQLVPRADLAKYALTTLARKILAAAAII